MIVLSTSFIHTWATIMSKLVSINVPLITAYTDFLGPLPEIFRSEPPLFLRHEQAQTNGLFGLKNLCAASFLSQTY